MNDKTNKNDEPSYQQAPHRDCDRAVSQIHVQGTIGKCLEQALLDVVSESAIDDTSQEQSESVSPSEATRFDADMADQVLRAYGDSAANSSWTCENTGENKRKAPPRAILQGSVDHFNRSGDRWRVIVNDAEIRPRVLLRRNKRRKRIDRTSLWEASEEQEPNESCRLTGPLLLMAYGDN